MSFFLRRVSDRAEAEDLTQEVFIRLLASVDRNPIQDADAFVFRIATNLLRDRARRAGVRAAAQLAEIDSTLVSIVTREFLEDRDPERVFLGRERVEAALRALGELGERTRDIYILFRLEAMKQRDIAALYGVSASTVEKEVMRANLHLARRLTEPDSVTRP